MDAASIVVAFSDSALLRETLTVLLEHDCQLQFLSPHAAALPDSPAPDLALVATAGSGPLLHELTRRWPTLPIVAVEMPDARAPWSSAPLSPRVRSVPLEPNAIRTVVRQELSLPADSTLRASVQCVTEALRHELSYSFTALRSFSALPVAGGATDTAAILGAVLREQSHVVDECVALLHGFQARPRAVEMAPKFVDALCHQLAQPEALAAERGMDCECVLDTSSPHTRGPVTLAPLLATFLRAHLRRRADASRISVRGTAAGLSVRYRLRPSPPAPNVSWPLLLASLALQPWSWHVQSATARDAETVRLCPTA